jgi:excisionase family DNA binding protein
LLIDRKADNMNHLTIIEAAKYLNRSTKTIRKYIKDGKLTAVMDEIPGGHRWMIPVESLEAFLVSPSTSNGITTVELQGVAPPQMGMEVLENLIMGMEVRLLEAIDARLEGMEKKKPSFWARLWGKG